MDSRRLNPEALREMGLRQEALPARAGHVSLVRLGRLRAPGRGEVRAASGPELVRRPPLERSDTRLVARRTSRPEEDHRPDGMIELESMVGDLLHGGRDKRTNALLASLASALEIDGELEV